MKGKNALLAQLLGPSCITQGTSIADSNLPYCCVLHIFPPGVQEPWMEATRAWTSSF